MSKRIRSWTSLIGAAAVVSSLSGALTAFETPGTTPVASSAPGPVHVASKEAERVRVIGEGGGWLNSTSWKGDRISIRVDASTEPGRPVGVDGTFHVSHRRPDGTLVAGFEGRAECLMAGGDVAVMTGIITHADSPGLPSQDLVGVRVGLTVNDHGRRDRIGWSWMVMGFHSVSGCTSTAPFFPVTAGDFAVDSPRETSRREG